MKIERRTIRVAVQREGEPCPTWPDCHCIMQGYLNLNEPNRCGKKPKTHRVVHEEQVDG